LKQKKNKESSQLSERRLHRPRRTSSASFYCFCSRRLGKKHPLPKCVGGRCNSRYRHSNSLILYADTSDRGNGGTVGCLDRVSTPPKPPTEPTVLYYASLDCLRLENKQCLKRLVPPIAENPYPLFCLKRFRL